MHKYSRVFAVILVGGKGKRLRPLSTNTRPKAFLSVTRDRKTMFHVTADRIRKIVPAGHILVSANRAHKRLVKKDLPGISAGNLVLEPVSRNTAPAIALAARILSLQNRSKDAIMIVLPADQYVVDEGRYLGSIKKGIAFARANDAIIVLGLEPTFPATGFGYVEIVRQGSGGRVQGASSSGLGTPSDIASSVAGYRDVYKVKKFTEKPDLKTAKRFIKDGRYLWNAGAFIFKANVILEAIRAFAPDIASVLDDITAANMGRQYGRFPDISIDYAVMEKAANIYCVKGSYRWRDIGSFTALKEVLEAEGRGFIEKGERVVKIL